MKKKVVVKVLGAFLVLGGSAALVAYTMKSSVNAAVIAQEKFDNLLLLLPDEVAEAEVAGTEEPEAPKKDKAKNPKVSVWLEAAKEEGIHVEWISDTEFLAMDNKSDIAGIILPDDVHVKASNALVTALDSYVRGGGKLLLTYDAGIQDEYGSYTPQSKFSELAGVDYSLYQQCYPSLEGCYVGYGPVTGQLSILQKSLRVPPGKSLPYSVSAASTDYLYLPVAKEFPSGLDSSALIPEPSLSKKDKGQSNLPLKPKKGGKPLTHAEKEAETSLAAVAVDPVDPVHALSTYFYGALTYPSLTTASDSSNADFLALLRSPQFGIQAGVNSVGLGKVLFVNLPLGWLKSYGTDGLLLHGFLHYFAVDMQGLPYLATVPGGKGGMVVNVHVDCGDANAAIETLQKQRVWNFKPFSVHYTAGPDCENPGDNLGLDVEHNTVTQKNLLMLSSKGHEIASHGGWIHQYFGVRTQLPDGSFTGVPDSYKDSRTPEFEGYLVGNKNAIETVNAPKKVVEYSAPEGNTPRWTVQWAKCNGILGYYFVGNTGMGPTRTYRQVAPPEDRRLDDVVDEYTGTCPAETKPIWSFPITPYREYATFDDFVDDAGAVKVSQPEATKWLTDLVDFVVQERTARLFYFHPPGVVDAGYIPSLLTMENRAAQYKTRFSWYTMAQLSTFLSTRQNVTWNASVLDTGEIQINATHSTNLDGQTWLLSKAHYKKPVGISGGVKITDDKNTNEWVVTANPGTTAVVFKAARL